MLEMENLNLKDSEVTPLSLIRDIAPRSMKVNIPPPSLQSLIVLIFVSWRTRAGERSWSLSATNQRPPDSRWSSWRPGTSPRWTSRGCQVRHYIYYLYVAFYKLSIFLDPYVKIYLLHKEQRISKKKTHVKKRTLNPVFNESFVFDLPRTDNGMTDIQLEFALLDWDRVTKNEVRDDQWSQRSPHISILGHRKT